MFSQACVKNSVHWGGGAHGGGHAWQGAGGMHAGGRVVRACMAGGVHGRGLRGRRDGHCSGRYASYLNAFLFYNALEKKVHQDKAEGETASDNNYFVT